MNARRLVNIAAAVLISIFCIQAIYSVPRLSATSDEPLHIAAGYSYWQTRDFRLNPEHPPLAKLISALPLLLIKPPLDTAGADWKKADQSNVGYHLLYDHDADRLLFWARAPMVA